MLKFKLLEVQAFSLPELHAWAAGTAYLDIVRERWDADMARTAWIDSLADDLVRAGAALREDGRLVNAG